MLSKTVYSYDDFSLTTTASSGIPGKGTPFSVRKNLTTIRRYTDASTYMDETFHYDDLGNVVSHTMPGGLTTTLAYTDAYGSAGNHNSYAFPTTITDPAGLTQTAVYNYNTGLPSSTTDERSLTTSFTYEGMNRVASVSDPGGLVTTYDYDDTNRKVTVSAAVTGSLNHVSEVYLDKLYRPIESVEKDPAGDVVTDTVYDGNGRAYRTSVPYRGGTDASTITAFDALDRPVVISNPDGASVAYDYNGNVTTITDEASAPRRMTVNAMGQLTKVEEPNPSLSDSLQL